jgi:hypothetical protein
MINVGRAPLINALRNQGVRFLLDEFHAIFSNDCIFKFKREVAARPETINTYVLMRGNI